MRKRLIALVIALGFLGLFQPVRSQLVQLRHWNGQGVSPVYEGYDVNPDGSFNMWFGYLNRNYEEEPDIPVGPNNHFEPGADRGQPTHFSTRRNKDVFRVIVPKDFGDKPLIWTLVANGQSAQVVGSLKTVWMIDRNRTTRGGNSENINSNTPPVATAQPAETTVTMPSQAILTISATDDGLPARAGRPVGMTVGWSKYRGPGNVVFSPAQSKFADGKATVGASFDAPGAYILQAVVDDGSGEVAGNFSYHCCWTNVQVRVTVK